MNNLGLREKAMMAVVGMTVLYVIAVVVWFTSAESAWKKSARNYGKECDRFEREERLIAQKGEWNSRYDAAKSSMPVFSSGKATDTTWLSRVETIASECLVDISGLAPGKEREAGEVLELPIEIKNFESSLEGLVKFMHALENSNEGMYDIGALSLRPSNKQGYIKGSMSLTCAYMREVE